MFILIATVGQQQYVSEHATIEHVTADMTTLINSNGLTVANFKCFRVDQEIPFRVPPAVTPMAPVPLTATGMPAPAIQPAQHPAPVQGAGIPPGQQPAEQVVQAQAQLQQAIPLEQQATVSEVVDLTPGLPL